MKTRLKSLFFILLLSLALAPSAFARDGAEGEGALRELEKEEIRKRLDAVELNGEDYNEAIFSIVVAIGDL